MVIAKTNRVGPTLRRTLAQGSALAAVLAIGGTGVLAANIPQGGVAAVGGLNVTDLNGTAAVVQGGALTVDSATINLAIEVQQVRSVINWTEFNIAAGRSVNFSAASGITNYAVLNRVVDTTATVTQILGALNSTSGGQVWVLNRAGVIFGATARIDTGSFVASALNITDANFGLAGAGSTFTFTRPIDGNAVRQLTIDGAPITVASGAIIGNVARTGPVLLVAPVISSQGAVRAGGDVGFVVAQAATVELSSTSILGIQIDAGTSLAANRLNLLAGSTADGARVFAVAAAQVDPVAALLNVQGSVTATRASVGENGIVLSAGADAGGTGGVTVVDPANVDVDAAIGGAALLTSANNVVVAANRDVLFGGTASIANGLATGASRVNAGRDVQISGTGAIVAAGAPLTITATRDIHLVGARQFNAVATLGATRDVLIDTLTGTTRFAAAATFTAGQDVVVDSAETVSLDADARFEATRDVSITLPAVTATGTLDVVAGADATIDATAGDARVDSGEATAGRLIVQATGDASLATGVAGTDLLLLGANAASTGSLTAGDDVTVVARAGNAMTAQVVATGLGADSEVDDTTELTDAAGATINDPTKAATALIGLAGSNALVIASGDASVTGATASTAARDIRVVAGDTFAATLNNGTATRDLLLLGGSASSTGTLTAGDDVTVVARAGTASVTTVVATGDAASTEANDATVLTDASGDTINDPTKAAATALNRLAGSNALVIASGNASVSGATVSTAARDLRVVAGDTALATLNNGTATRDLLLLGGSATSTGTLTAGDDVTVVARDRGVTLQRVVATGLGVDSETNDATLLTDASGGTINDPTKAAATALTGFAGSNALVIAIADASVTGATASIAARDLRVVAGDASLARLNNGTATRDLLLLGGSAGSSGTLTAGDDVTVVARAGTAAVTTVVATGLAASTEANDAAALTDASGDTINDPTKVAVTALNRLAGSNALVIASASASVSGATVSTAARDLRVVAGDTALATLNNGAATRDLLLLGGGSASSGTLMAGDDVTVVARAGTASVTTVVATGLAASTEANDTTALTDASGDTINDPTKVAATALSRLAGSNALVIASADASVSGATASTAARDIRVVAGDTTLATLNNGTATRDLLLLGGTAGSSGTLTAGDDVTVVARAGAATLQRVVATGGGVDSETNDTTLLTDASGGTINDPTKGAATALTGFAGSNALVIASGDASVAGATASTADRDLRVVAGNGSLARLNNGTATRDLLLLGGSATSTGTLTAGDDVTVVARGGTATLSRVVATGVGADSETNDTTLLTDASGGTINDPTKGAVTALTGFAESNVLVIASADASVTGATASTADRDLRVVAGNASLARLNNGTATRDLLLLGGRTASTGTLTAGDDIVVVARTGNATLSTVAATGLATSTEASDAAVLTDASGGTINDPTKAAATALTGFAGSNALVIASADASVTGATASTAARDLRVVAGDASTASLNDGAATRDLLLLGGSASSTGTLTAGDDVVVVARAGNATLTTVVATGLGADSETDDTSLLTDASGGTINDPTKGAAAALTGFAGSNALAISGLQVNVIGATASTADRDLRVVAGNASTAQLENGTATRDLLLLGGEAVSSGTLRAGDDVVVVARAGVAALSTVVATGLAASTEASDATVLTDASGGTINDPTKGIATALAGFAGSNALVIASGGASVTGATVSTAARDLRVVAGDASTAILFNGTATRDLLLLGGSASSTGTLTAGDDVVVVARAGNATLATVVATGLGADSETDDTSLLNDASGGTINDPTKGAATALIGFAGSNTLVIASGDASVTGATASTAARDLRVVAGDASTASLNNGTATRDLLLLGGSATSTGTLTAGDDVTVVARGGTAILSRVVATGGGVDSETNDTTLLTDASGGTINDPTKGAAAALTGFAGSNALVIASGDASVAGAAASTADRDLRIVAGNASLARLNNGTATRDLLLLGGRTASTGTLTAGDDVVVVARAGNAALSTVVATGLAASAEASDAAVLTDASGGTINDPTKAAATALTRFAGSNALVIASANASVTGATASTAARDLRVVAGDASTASLNDGAATRDLLLLGGSASSTGTLTAGDDVVVVARAGNATLATVVATGLGADSETDDTSLLTDASGGTINDPTKGAATALTGFAGSNALVIASADASVTGATVSTAARDLRVVAGDASTAFLNNGTATRDLLLLGGSTSSTGILTAGDDVTAVARGGTATLTRVVATGLGADSETNDTTLLTDASGDTINDPTKVAPAALIGFAGSNALVIASSDASVTGATASTAARDLRVVAGNASTAVLNNGSAARDLLLLGGGGATGTTLTAGDDLALVARGGTATVGQLTATGGGSDSEAGNATALFDASGAAIANPATGSGMGDLARLAGSNIVVAASGAVTANTGTAFAATDVRLASGAGVLFGDARAGRDLLVVGTTVVGTNAQAGDDVAPVARTGAVSVATLTSTGVGLNAVTGANLGSASIDSETDAAGLAGLANASTIADPTKGVATALTRFAGNNALAIGATTATVTTATAPRDVRVVAGDASLATLTNGTAGRDLLLLGGSAASGGSLVAGDDATVVAFSGTASVNVAGLTATAGADSESGSNAALLLDASNGAVSDPYLWRGNTSVDTLGGRNIVIVGTTGVMASTIGDTAAITARAVTAGGSSTVDGATAASLVLVGTRDPGGSAALNTGTSGGDIVITGGGFASLVNGTAGNDIIVSGGSASLTDGTAGNDIFVLANSGDANVVLARTLGTTDGSDTAGGALTDEFNNEVSSTVTGRRIDRIDGSNIIVEAQGNVTAGTLSTALGSGRDVRVGALGSADVTTAGALRDVVVSAGTAVTATTLVANRDVTVLGASATVRSLVAGDDVVVVARNGAADITTARALGRTLGVDPADAGGFGVPTAISALGNEASAGAALVDLALDPVTDPAGTGAISGLVGANVFIVASQNATLSTGVAATDLKLVAATGAATLGNGAAGQDLLVLGDTVSVTTRATAGDDVALVARAGDIVLGNAVTVDATGQAFDASTAVFSGAVGGGLASEAGDATALLGLSGNAINDPTKAAPTALVGFGGSNVLVIASGDATVPAASAPRDVRVVAGGDAALVTGVAGRDLLLLASGGATGTTLTAGDDLAVVARGGTAMVGQLTATGGGSDSETGDATALFDASGAAIANPATGSGAGDLARLSGSNIVVAASGAVTANTGTAFAATDVRLASGAGVLFGDARAGRDLLVVGTTVDGTNAQAGDDVALVARTGAVSVATLTSTGFGLNAFTGASLGSNAADSETDTAGLAGLANASTIADPTKGVATALTGLAGSNALAIGATTATVTTATAPRDVRVVAGGDAALVTGVAGRDLLLLAGGNATSATSLTAGDDVVVVAQTGAALINFAGLTATSGSDSEAGNGGSNALDASGAAIADPYGWQGSATINTLAGSNVVIVGNSGVAASAIGSADLRPRHSRVVTVAGDISLPQAFATDLVWVGSRQGLVLLTQGDSLGSIVVKADSAAATLTSGTAGADISVFAGTTATLVSGNAGDDIFVLAGGDAIVTSAITAGSSDTDTGASALPNEPGIGDLISIVTGRRIDRLDGSNILVEAGGNASATTLVAGAGTGRDIRVGAIGSVNVTTASARRDVTLQGGGAVTAQTLVANRDVTVIGASADVDTAIAGDDVSVVARTWAAQVTTARAYGVTVGLDPANAATFGVPISAPVVDNEADAAAILVDLALAPVIDPTGTTAIRGLAGSNILIGGATTARLGSGVAASDLKLVAANGAATLETGLAGQDLLVVGTRVQIDGIVRAGDDIGLVARAGDIVLGNAVTVDATGQAFDASTAVFSGAVGGGLASEAGDATALLGLSGNAINDPTKAAPAALVGFGGSNVLVIASGNATVPAASAPRDVRVVAGGDAALATGVAGRDLLLLAGGNALGTTLTAGDDLAVVARGGTATVGQLTATGGGSESETGDTTALFDASGAAIANPATGSGMGDLARLAGSNIVVAASGAVTANTGTAFAATDVRLASGAGVLIGDARAGRDLLVMGTTVDGTTVQAGDDVALVARTGAVSVATLTSTGLGLNAVTGANLAAAATNGDTDAAGLAGLTSGSTIDDPTKAGNSSALTGFAGNNVLAIGSTTVAVTTAMAPRDVRVVAGTNAALATGTAGRDLLLLAGGAATSATSLTAGDDVTVVARGGDATVAIARATGLGGDSEAADTTTLADASGAVINDPSVPASPPALSGLALSNVLVSASGNTTVADAQAPRDIRVAAAGDVRLTTGVATTRNITLDAGGVAGANLLTAGGNLNVTASDIDLFSVSTPVALAPLVSLAGTTTGTGAAVFTVRNRNGAAAAATSAVVIGDVTNPPAPATSWTLNNTELGAIQATSIDIVAGTRTVSIGTATPFTATSGTVPRVARFGVETTGAINVVGVLSFNGADRVLTLGGRTADAENAATPTADVIRVVAAGDPATATSQPNGQILADGGAIRLRSRVISVGQQELFQSQITPGGVPIAQSLVVSNFFVNTSSSLYRAIPGYVRPATPPAAQATYLRASTLALTVGDYALLQNTGVQIQPGGGTVLGAVNLYSSTPGDGAPTIAIFGSINGRDGAAASLQTAQITLNGISPINVRVNGCIALQGSGCVVSNFAVPDPRLANPSSAFLLTVAPSLTLPIDLVSGATNEALWRTERCEESDKPCPKPESNR